jgi:hypothetical protein
MKPNFKILKYIPIQMPDVGATLRGCPYGINLTEINPIFNTLKVRP